MVSGRQPLPWHIPPICSATSCDPRLLPKVSLHSDPSIVSSCETPMHSTNAIVPFFRAPLNLTVYFFIVVLSRFWRFCRRFFPWCAWRAREKFDWTWGTNFTHTSRKLRLVWLSYFSLAGWAANEASHRSRCSTPLPLHSRPPPPPAPASTSRVPLLLP